MHNLSYLLSLLALAVLFIFTGGQNQTTSSEVEQSATPEPTSTLVNVASSRSVTSEILLEPVFPTPVDDAGSGGMLPSLFPLNPTPVPQTVPSGSSFTIAQANLSQKFVGDGLCGCDLLVGQCDTLCCCDNDCSVASRVVFDCSTISSSEVCLDFEGVFRTSLSRCSCADSSLLCIVYEQDPSRLHYGPAVVVESTEQFSTLELLHRLPGDHGILLQLATHSSNYSVGDPILVVNNNTASPFYDTLTVPAPFNGVQCHDGNPITYLANRQYKCSRSLDNLSTECATLSALAYVDLSLLQIPDHLIRDEIYGDIPLVLSSVSCRINSTSFQPCELMSAVFDPDTNVCRKSVLQASFIFVHDGRGCLLNASVIFFLGEVGEGSLTQQFTVKFIEDINSTVKQLKRSGNPGYVSGETILAGALTELRGIDITIDSSFWLHVQGSGRRCTEERPRIPVQFGQDLVTSCLMVVSLSDLVTDCPGVRRRAYSVLSMDIFLDHVGRYGNSDPTNISQWLRIINETVDAMPSLRDLCTGVPTRLDITILYSNTGDFMQPQPVLSGIRFIYFTQNIASELIQSGNLVMSTSVRYIDVSAESIQVLPAVTATVMELPQDFLYPFFVSSAVTFLVPSSVVSLTALLLGLLQGGV